jgi:predicted permease
VHRLFCRIRSLFLNLLHRSRVERELDAEVRAMFDLLVDEGLARGVPLWQARRGAAMELGGVEPLKEYVRDAKMGTFIDSLLNDVRYAYRHLRASPGFAAAAIAILALGIGATTAMFGVLDALTLQRLAIRNPDGLLSLSSYDERGRKRYIPMPTVVDISRQGPFQEACGYNGGGSLPMEANGIPTQGIAAFVTGACFRVFGVAPVLGRGILDADAPIMTAGAKVVVISDRIWQRLFSRDPNVVGKALRIESEDAMVIGVLPPAFRGIHADTGIDVFAPPDSIFPATQGRRPVAQEVLGRLKPGVSFTEAAAQFDAMWPALLEQARAANREAAEGTSILGPIVRLDPMGKGLSPAREEYAQSIGLILGLSALFLILACINLGGLLLTRVDARSRELGVRIALGGSRRRIAQQMFVESLLLAGTGTLLAVAVAFVLSAQIPSFLDTGYVGWERSFAPDLRVLSMSAAIGVLVSLLLTALPVWLAWRWPVSQTFIWGRTVTGAAGRWTRGLLAAQIALSLVMVTGAALLARSLYEIQQSDPGVRTNGILTADLMSVPGGRVGLDPQTHYAALTEKLRAIPGVTQVGYSSVFPRRLALLGSDVGFRGEAFTGVRASLDSVSVNFFELMEFRLLAGRTFEASDTRQSRRVVILSEGLARALAPDGDILNRRLKYATQREMQDLVVVGVVSNATQGNLKNSDVNVMYSPAMQSPAFSTPNLLLEIRGDAATIGAAVRRVVLEHGREYVDDLTPLDALLARGPARERMSALLSGIIGSLALIIAVIGVHGVLACSVARRRRELGVRIAIGAVPHALAASIVRDGLILTLAGVLLGLPLAYFAARFVKSLMFGISETDPVMFAGVALTFLVLGAIAGVLPARRAARVDPAIALRAE